MDPLTQGLLGAVAADNANKPAREKRIAAGLGFLAGMAADLDVLIRSSSDPLLFLEFHRQFTHSLIFIPLGGLICGLVLHHLLGQKRGLSRHQSVLFCTLGYATHALLDACTTYGTQLLWPFSNERIAWNVISIIDPLYTLPIAGLLILSLRKHWRWASRAALAWVLLYPSIGWWQRERAEALGYELAASRGHQVTSLEAKPSFANLLLWKTIYLSDDRYYVDAVKVGETPKRYNGGSIAKLNVAEHLPWLEKESQQAIDVARFSWFSQDYVALHPQDPAQVVDIRYSMLPNELQPIWGIELSPERHHQHVRFRNHRENSGDKAKQLWRMIVD